MNSAREAELKLIDELTEEIWPHVAPLLAGKDPKIQGAVLADLLARWLAGHFVRGDDRATELLREKLLDFHTRTVRKLVPINAKMMGTDDAKTQH